MFRFSSKLTNMTNAFENCTRLESITFPAASGWDTSGVTSMANMFLNNFALQGVDMSTMSVASVSNMTNLFANCYSMTTVDLTGWELNKATKVNGTSMFTTCRLLKTIWVSNNWDYTRFTDNTNMFTNCVSLKGAAGITYASTSASTQPSSNAVITKYMSANYVSNTVRWKLNGDGSLVLSPVSGDSGMLASFGTTDTPASVPWYTLRNNVLEFYIESGTIGTPVGGTFVNMFRDCQNMTSCDLTGLDTDNAASFYNMFKGCKRLKTLDLSGFRTSRVTDMQGMFYDCQEITSLDFSNCDFVAVQKLSEAFKNCVQLSSITWPTTSTGTNTNLTTIESMFEGCAKLIDLDLTYFNTSKTVNMSKLFKDCAKLEQVNVSTLDTSRVTNMSFMFDGCLRLKYADLNSFNVSAVTSFENMFNNCSVITTVVAANWSLNRAGSINCNKMFYGCGQLSHIYVGTGWVQGLLGGGTDMFTNDAKLPNFNANNKTSAYATTEAYLTYADYVITFEYLSYATPLTPSFEGYTAGEAVELPTPTREGYSFLGWYLSDNFLADEEVFLDKDGKYTPIQSETLYANWEANDYSIIRFESNGGSAVAPIQGTAGETIAISLPEPTRAGYSFVGWYANEDLSGNAITRLPAKIPSGVTVYYAKWTANTSQEGSWGQTNNQILWSIDNNGELLLSASHDNYGILGTWGTSPSSLPWYQYKAQIKSFRIQSGHTIDIPRGGDGTMYGFFSEFSNLERVDMTGFDTRNATSFEKMFYKCALLEDVTFSTARHTDASDIHFDVSSSTSFVSMFEGCSILSELDLSNAFWMDGARPATTTTMASMFKDCPKLETLTIPTQFECPNNTSVASMFQGCTALKSVNLSAMNTSKLANMSNLFYNCTTLTDITWPQVKMDTRGVSTMQGLFRNCYALPAIDLSGFATTSLVDASYMFSYCSSLTELDLTMFDVSKVNNMNYMFQCCYEIQTIDLGSWTLLNGVDCQYMFEQDSKLTSVFVGSGWNRNYIKNYSSNYYMFRGCTAIKGASGVKYKNTETYPGAASYADTANYLCAGMMRQGSVYWSMDGEGVLRLSPVSGESGTFDEWSAEANVPWYAQRANVKRMEIAEGTTIGMARGGNFNYMFASCTQMTYCDVANLNFSNITALNYMFRDCNALEELNFSEDLYTPNLASMVGMFQNCYALTTLDVHGFYVFKVTSMEALFNGCRNLESINMDMWRPNANRSFADTFNGCTKLKAVDFTKFDASTTMLNVSSTYRMFTNCSSIESIVWHDDSRFNSLTNMQQMFDGCSYLRQIDITPWVLPKVQNMSYMFRNCIRLWNIQFPQSLGNGLDLTNINRMFYGCTSYESISLNALEVGGIQDNMQYLFYGCTGLKEIDLSDWVINPTSNKVNINYSFYGCTALKTIYVGTGWNVAYLADVNFAFTRCFEIVGAGGPAQAKYNSTATYPGNSKAYGFYGGAGYLCAKSANGTVYWRLDGEGNLVLSPVSGDEGTLATFGTSRNTTAGNAPWWSSRENVRTVKMEGTIKVAPGNSILGMFDGCSALVDADLTGFDTEGCVNMSYMFMNCSSLEFLDLGNIDTQNVTTMAYMFNDCNKLGTIGVDGFNTAKVRDMQYMFYSCDILEFVDLSQWNTSQLRIMNYMFGSCGTLRRIDMSSFTTGELTQAVGTFSNCYKIETVDTSHFSGSKMTTLESMFENCYMLKAANLSSVNGAPSLNNVMKMFKQCRSLVSLNLGTTFNVGSSTLYQFDEMFNGCTSITEIDMTGMVPRNNPNNFTSMFLDCTSLQTIDLSTWTMYTGSQTQTVSSMFKNCRNLITVYVGSGWYTSTANLTQHTDMFLGCISIMGASGTAYQSNTTNPGTYTFAKVGPSGYLSAKRMVKGTTWWSLDYRGELMIQPASVNGTSGELSGLSTSTGNVPWLPCAANIRSFKIKEGTNIGVATGHTLDNMFNGCTVLTDVNLSGLNTSKATEMKSMFQGCTSLEELDVSTISTTSAVYLDSMFKGCTKLRSVTGFRGFSNQGMRTATSMFESCNALESLDLTGFYASAATNLNSMFKECWAMETLDIPNMSPRGAEYLRNMFQNCKKLDGLVLSNFATAAVKQMDYMFDGCESLTTLDLSSFETGSATNMEFMFRNCKALETIDISALSMLSNKSCQSMFENCQALTDITAPVTPFAMPQCTTTNSMFKGCESMVDFNANWMMPIRSTDMQYMFANCYSLTYLDISDWTLYATSNSISMNNMFLNDVALTTVFVGQGWTQSSINANNSTTMFLGAVAIKESDNTVYRSEDSSAPTSVYAKVGGGYLSAYKMQCGSVLWSIDRNGRLYLEPVQGTTGALTGFGTSTNNIPWYTSRDNIKSFAIKSGTTITVETNNTLANMFKDCTNLETVNLTGLDTRLATDMRYMFYNCPKLTTIDVGGFDTTYVTNMSYMFAKCIGLQSITNIKFGGNSVKDMTSMFEDCSSLVNLNLTERYDTKKNLISKFVTTAAENMTNMFKGCSSLELLDVSDFSTSLLKYADHMFDGCSTLTEIDITDFVTPSLLSASYMFSGCSTLLASDVSNLTLTTTTNIEHFYDGCSSLVTADMRGWVAPVLQKMNHFFNGCGKLEAVNFPTGMATANLTTVESFFDGCSSLTGEISMNFLVANKITNTTKMFNNCSSVEVIDLSGWTLITTNGAITASDMFYGCTNLQTIFAGTGWRYASISSSNGTNVFTGCFNLTGPGGVTYRTNGTTPGSYTFLQIGYEGGTTTKGYLTLLTTKNTTNANPVTWSIDENGLLTVRPVSGTYGELPSMTATSNVPWYPYRNQITGFDIPTGLTVGVVEGGSLAYMFADCMNMVADASSFEGLTFANCVSTAYMFQNCHKVTSVDMRPFAQDRLQNMSYMFNGSTGIQRVYASGKGDLNFNGLVTFTYMFQNCTKLQSVELPNFKAPAITNDTLYLFSGCTNLRTIDMKNMLLGPTSQSRAMQYWFNNCRSIESADFTNSSFTGITNIQYLFTEMRATGVVDFRGSDFSRVSGNNVAYMGQNMYSGEVRMDEIAFTGVTNLYYMFYYFRGGSIHLERANFTNVTNMQWMCRYMAGGDIYMEGIQLGNNKISDYSGLYYMLRNATGGTLHLNKISWPSNITGFYYMCYDVNGASLDMSGTTFPYLRSLWQMVYSGRMTTVNFNDCSFNHSYFNGGYDSTGNSGSNAAGLRRVLQSTTVTNFEMNRCRFPYQYHFQYWTESSTVTNFNANNCEFGLNNGNAMYVTYMFNASTITNVNLKECIFYRCNTLQNMQNSGMITNLSFAGSDFQYTSTWSLSSAFSNTNYNRVRYYDFSNCNFRNVTNANSAFSGNTNVYGVNMENCKFRSNFSAWNSTFNGATNLKTVSLRNVSQTSVNDIYHMFYNCNQMQTCDTVGFRTGQLSCSMDYMFYNCQNLRGNLDLSGMNLTGVNNMSYAFQNCYYLEYIDLSSQGATALTLNSMSTADYMFHNCQRLVQVKWPQTINSNAWRYFRYMFQECYALKDPGFYILNSTYSSDRYYEQMFYNCTALEYVDMSGWNMYRARYLNYMFYNCQQLKKVNMDWSSYYPNGNSYYYGNFIFYNCVSLEKVYCPTDITGPNWFHSSYSTHSFYNCKKLNPNCGTSNNSWTQIYNHGYGSTNGNTNEGYFEFSPASIHYSYIDFKVNPHATTFAASCNTTGDATPLQDVKLTDAEFTGWYTNAACTTFAGAAGTTYQITKNEALYPGFNRMSVITFETNVASKVAQMKGMAGEPMGNIAQSYLDNHVFEGWYTKNGYNAKGTTDEEMWAGDWGEEADLSVFPDSNMTVYAKFSVSDVLTGHTGQNYGIVWTIDEDQNLTLSVEGSNEGTLNSWNADTSPSTTQLPWNKYKANIRTFSIVGGKSIYIPDGGSVREMFKDYTSMVECDLTGLYTATATSAYQMFYNCQAMDTLILPASVNTGNMTTMYQMFYDCRALQDLDLTHFSTAAVNNMYQMFMYCRAMETLTLSDTFVTGKVNTFYQMFYECNSLLALDLSSFNTVNVNDMQYMFYKCSSLHSLDLTGFRATAVTNMQFMFYGCTVLEELLFPTSQFTSTALTNMRYMFAECPALVELDLRGFVVSAVAGNETMTYLFYKDSSLETVDLSTWTLNGTNGSTSAGLQTTYMFGYCEKLKTVFVGNGWNVSKLRTDVTTTFYACYSIKGATGYSYNISNSTPGNYAFASLSYYLSAKMVTGTVMWSLDGTGHLMLEPTVGTYGEFASFGSTDTPANVPWYSYRTGIKSFSVKKDTTVGVQAGGYVTNMFRDCTVLADCDLTGLDTSQALGGLGMFKGCGKIAKLDLSGFDTHLFSTMESMFEGCGSLADFSVTSFATAQVTSMKNMFKDCAAMQRIDLSQFATDKLTNIEYMFYGCAALQALDMTAFVTTTVSKMNYAFDGCAAMTTADISSFSFSDCEEARNMFHGCRTLKSVALPTIIDFSDMTTIQYMFAGCAALETVDFSGMRAPTDNKIATMNNMFDGCSSLTGVTWPESITLANVTTMNYMFHGCTSLKKMDISPLVVTSSPTLEYMFANCSNIEMVDIYTWTRPSKASANYMFLDDSKLTTVYVNANWTSKAGYLDGTYVFAGCFDIVGYDGTTYQYDQTNPGNGASYAKLGGGYLCLKSQSNSVVWAIDGTGHLEVMPLVGNEGEFATFSASATERTDASVPWNAFRAGIKSFSVRENTTVAMVKGGYLNGMFFNCPNLTTIDMRGFDSSSAAGAFEMFRDCTSLTSINLTGFKTNLFTNMQEMFYNCSKLESLNLNEFDTAQVTNMAHMFYNCQVLDELNLTRFVTSQVANMAYMFYNCRTLASLDLSSFQTAAVTNFNNMFQNCVNITSADISGFNTPEASTMASMFAGCAKMQEVKMPPAMDVRKLTTMVSMFEGCGDLKSLDFSCLANPLLLENMSRLFYGCADMEEVIWPGTFPTAKLTNMSYMFYGCASLTEMDMTMFTTNKVTNFTCMFAECHKIKVIDIYTWAWNASNNTIYIEQMFYNCYELHTLYAGTNLAGATSYFRANNFMFTNCFNIKGVGAFAYDTTSTTPGASSYFKLSSGYASVKAVSNTATWSINGQGEFVLAPVAGNYGEIQDLTTNDAPASYVPWYAYRTNVTSFYVKPETRVGTGVNFYLTNMFRDFAQLQTADMSRFDTANAVGMYEMFYGCTSLENLDLSTFDTSKVTNMSYMFYNCSKLQTLDISSFDVSKVNNMAIMFTSCTKLQSIELPEVFNSSNVQNMSQMFDGCQALESIDLSGFNTPNVLNMSYMFRNCRTLTELDLTAFNTTKVEAMDYMFRGCGALQNVDISSFDLPQLKTTTYMFQNCTNLAQIAWPEGSMHTASLNSMQYMFDNCNALEALDLTGFVVTSCTRMDYMMRYCYSLKMVDLSSWTLYSSNGGVNSDYMFYNDYELETIYVGSSWSQSRFGSYNTMFTGCESLKGAGNFPYQYDSSNPGSYSYANVGTSGYLCPKYQTGTAYWSLDGYGNFELMPIAGNYGEIASIGNASNPNGTNAPWNSLVTNIRNVTVREGTTVGVVTNGYMSNMFKGCTNLVNCDVSRLDTTKANGMGYMFQGCTSLVDLDVSNFNTSNCLRMDYMFNGCKKLKMVDLRGFDLPRMTTTAYMFYECSVIESIMFAGTVNTYNVTDMSYMFYGCSMLAD